MPGTDRVSPATPHTDPGDPRSSSPVERATEGRIGCVVVDCRAAGFVRPVAFWQATLGYPVGVRSDDWCRLDDPHRRVNRSLQSIPNPTPGKNKLHSDLDTGDQPGEVEHPWGLGATPRRWSEPGDVFALLAAPAENSRGAVDTR